MKWIFLLYNFNIVTDYEPSLIINETEYQQNLHHQQQYPYARNGYNFGYRPLIRASKFNRMQQHNADYGFEVRHNSGGGGFDFENEQPQYDYNDDSRDVNVNFYDNKYYDSNFKLHRWV